MTSISTKKSVTLCDQEIQSMMQPRLVAKKVASEGMAQGNMWIFARKIYTQRQHVQGRFLSDLTSFKSHKESKKTAALSALRAFREPHLTT